MSRGLVGFSGAEALGHSQGTNMQYGQSNYLQAVGQFPEPPFAQFPEPPFASYYQTLPEPLSYPNAPGSSYLSPFGHATSHEPLWGYGQDPPPAPGPPPAEPPPTPNGPLVGPAETGAAAVWGAAWTAASIAGTAAGAYHGYKRNDSVGWAIAWGLLGGLFPIIVLPLAYAQGFGKRKAGR